MSVPFLFCSLVTAISAFTSLGFSVQSVRDSAGPTRTAALYTTARSVAFAVVSVVPLLTGSLGWLKAVATGLIILQTCDAVIGITIKDRLKTFGPAGTAILNLAALLWLTAR